MAGAHEMEVFSYLLNFLIMISPPRSDIFQWGHHQHRNNHKKENFEEVFLNSSITLMITKRNLFNQTKLFLYFLHLFAHILYVCQSANDIFLGI